MGIPLADHNPTRRKPVVNWLLLASNIAVFFLLEPWNDGPCTQQQFFLQYAAVPDELLTGEPLDAAEVTETTTGRCDLAPIADKPVYLSVLSAMFLHGGIVHLGSNMLYLAIFGNNIEDRFGHLRYLVFYLGTGVVATVVFAAANADSTATLVGASGAIAGVLGAYLVLFPGVPVTVYFPPFFVFALPALIVLGMWFVLQLVALQPTTGLAGSNVAYLAHVAGFAAGLVVTLLFRRRRPQRAVTRYDRYRRR